MPLVVNLYSLDESCKVEGAAYIYNYLTSRGINTAIVTEYPEERGIGAYIIDGAVMEFGRKLYRQACAESRADVVITTAPLPLSILYGKDSGYADEFNELVSACYHRYDNLSYFLLKDTDNIDESQELSAVTLMDICERNNIHFVYALGTSEHYQKIAEECCMAFNGDGYVPYMMRKERIAI